MLNFVYISETEESYLLYLGTDITKIKNHEADRRSKDQFSVGL